MYKLLITSILSSILLFSCTKKKEEETIITNPTSKAIYISNEGAFGYNNASLSVYYPDNDKLINQVFKSVNNRGLGDVLQSIYHYDNNIYLVVNASSKIEIANASDFKEKGVINNISMPRYMQICNNKAYVSCWGDGGYMAVINVDNNSLIQKIKVGNGPEKIIADNNNLIVCNSGGFTNDSTISIINLNTNNLYKTIVVGDNPIDISYNTDSSYFYVLCKGKIIYDASWNIIGHTASKLVKVKNSTLSIESEIKLFDRQHPSDLVFNALKNSFYIGGGYGFAGIYSYNINNAQLDTNAISTKNFYGISADSESHIYGFESPDFSRQGNMVIMDSYGNILKDAIVGVGPNGMSE